MASLVDDFGVKIQNFVSEKTFTTKRKKVANNDFTGKKSIYEGAVYLLFFLRSFCEKKKNVRKEAWTLRN